MFWSVNSELCPRIFELQTCRYLRFWQHGQNRDDKRFSGCQWYHQVVHIVLLALFQVALGDCLHDGHAAGNAQKHGGFTAEEVVVEQKVAAHAYVDQSMVR